MWFLQPLRALNWHRLIHRLIHHSSYTVWHCFRYTVWFIWVNLVNILTWIYLGYLSISTLPAFRFEPFIVSQTVSLPRTDSATVLRNTVLPPAIGTIESVPIQKARSGGTCWTFFLQQSYPYAPCMEYLPTFALKITQMWLNIPYMEYMGYVLWQLCACQSHCVFSNITLPDLRFRWNRPIETACETINSFSTSIYCHRQISKI